MVPLDKYVPDKHGKAPTGDLNESPDKKSARKESEQTEKSLRDLRSRLLADFTRMRGARIREAAASVKAEFAGENEKKNSNETYKDLQDKRRAERMERYKDKNEAMKAFEEIVDFKNNRENFSSAGGWQEQYYNETDETGKTPSEKMPIEAYVLEKQNEQLQKIWDTVVESRISNSFKGIYPDLDGEETADKRQFKLEEKNKKTQQFFSAQTDLLNEYFSTGISTERRTEVRASLMLTFKSTVFDDLQLDDPTQLSAKVAVESLFSELLVDYENMISSRKTLWILNNTMVENLTNPDLTEEEWLKALANKAEEEAKKLEEERKSLEDQKSAESSGTAGAVDLSVLNNTGTIRAGEVLASDTRITIELLNPRDGTYKVKFPAESGEGMETRLQARRVPAADGKSWQERFVFTDPLLPYPKVVGKNSLRGGVNELYLRHVMGESVKQGKDYLGPDLSSIMTAAEINFIAGNLFFPGNPERLNEVSMTPEQAKIFRNLILLVTNSNNNRAGEADKNRPYGNLLAVGSRIKLLTYVINPANGANNNRSTWFEYLKNADNAEIRSSNLETFCTSQMKVPVNNGNFTERVK